MAGAGVGRVGVGGMCLNSSLDTYLDANLKIFAFFQSPLLLAVGLYGKNIVELV